MALPRNYERERRFINLYRQHDFLRDLDDEAYQRFVEYMDGSTRLVVEVMEREGAIGRAQPARKAAPKTTTARKKSTARKKAPKHKAPPSSAGKTARSDGGGTTTARPTVRKVKPRNAPKT